MFTDKRAFALAHRHAHACTHTIQISSIALIKSNSITKTGGIINTDKDRKTIPEAPYDVGADCNTIILKSMVRMKGIC